MSAILGNTHPQFILYVPRKIPFGDLANLDHHRPAQADELTAVMTNCSNDWRKIFSTFAKLIHQTLMLPGTWQTYRDTALLQANGHAAICFNSTLLNDEFPNSFHLIGGRQLFNSMNIGQHSWKCIESEEDICKDKSPRLFWSNTLYQTPYFDYRQFPNHLIESLAKHLRESLSERKTTAVK